jgi:multisubunit Na+/H+ antiporter MnhG subunit
VSEPERDLTVATALLGLRPPEHGDDFWDRLDHKLAEAEMAASREAVARHSLPGISAPADPEPVTVAPAAIANLHRSRPSARGRAAVLGAAALLLAVVAFAVIRAGDPTPAGRAREAALSATTVAPMPANALASTTTEVGVTPIDREPADPEAAGRDWIAAVAKGDTERAWELLGPTSRHRMGSYELFAPTMMKLSDDYGPWDSAGLQTSRLPLADASSSLFVVTFTGTVSGSGSPAKAARAMPVRLVAPGTFRVEPFSASDTDVIVFTTPDEYSPPPFALGRYEPLEARVPAKLAEITVTVDDGPPQLVPVERVGMTDMAKLSYQQQKDGWAAGSHVVTVAYLNKSGAFAARAILFAVSGH